MNRRTMLLGTIGAAVGAVFPKATKNTVCELRDGFYADDKVLAAYRRWLREIEQCKAKLLQLKEGSAS